MFSSNLTKFFALATLSLLLFAGCRFLSKTSDANSSAAPPVSEDLKSVVPFSTKEPERFRAEMVVTAGATEHRTFVARNGANRRWDFNFGAKNQLTRLQTDKSYLLSPAQKIYTEMDAGQTVSPDEWAAFLTTRWLNEIPGAIFEKLEAAENLTKYRVRLDESSASEIIVFIDETHGLPVRQEFYSVAGEQKSLTYTFELKNLKLETDADLFAVPPDFRPVAAEEFWKRQRSEEQK
jgi:hypothetical protein